MNKNKILQFLKTVNSKPSVNQNRSGFIIATCPYAKFKHDSGVDKHPSFAIRIADQKVSRYNCFSCSSHGDLYDMVQELKSYKVTKDEGFHLGDAMSLITTEQDEVTLEIIDYEHEPENPNKIEIFPEWWLDSFNYASKSKKAMKYVADRGLSKEIVKALDLRYDSMRNRVCFPLRDWDGFLVGLHGRAINPAENLRYYAYKYQDHWNKLVWLGEQWIDPESPVVLVESVFDLASVYRVYPNVLCSLSVGMGKEKIKRVAELLDIVTLYDEGKGGDAARKSLTKYLGKSAMVHRIPTKEQNDPGNMSVQEIISVLDGLVPLDTEGL